MRRVGCVGVPSLPSPAPVTGLARIERHGFHYRREPAAMSPSARLKIRSQDNSLLLDRSHNGTGLSPTSAAYLAKLRCADNELAPRGSRRFYLAVTPSPSQADQRDDLAPNPSRGAELSHKFATKRVSYFSNALAHIFIIK
jgi:hypothetical protein